jgi:hypothetical protein
LVYAVFPFFLALALPLVLLHMGSYYVAPDGLGSSDPPVSAFRGTGTTGMYHLVWLLLVEMMTLELSIFHVCWKRMCVLCLWAQTSG